MTSRFVMPAGGSYGAADGSSYSTPYDGLANVVEGDFSPGDVLYLVGNFTQEELLIITMGGTAELPIQIRGQYAIQPRALVDAETANDYCVHISNVDYVHVYDMDLKNGGDGLSAAGQGLKFDNCTGAFAQGVYASGSYYDGISMEQCIDSHIYDCDAEANLLRGLSISGSAGPSINCTITHSRAIDNGRRGFTISGLNNTQNTINCGVSYCYSYGNGAGFQLGNSNNCYVTFNISANETNVGLDPLHGEVYCNIDLIESVNARVMFNHFTGNNKERMMYITDNVTNTCGNLRLIGNMFKDYTHTYYAVAFTGTNSPNPTISGNLFKNCYRGLRILDNVNQYIGNNVFIDTDECIRTNTAVTSNNLTIANNIFAGTNLNNPSDLGYIYCGVATGNVYTISNNHYFKPDGLKLVSYNGTIYSNATIASLDTSATTGDPLFVDPPNDDYSLPVGSALAKTGKWLWSDKDILGIDGEPFMYAQGAKGYKQPTNATDAPYHTMNS